MKMVISYDVVEQTVKIEENEFTNIEALGILESVKAMIVDDWFKESD